MKDTRERAPSLEPTAAYLRVASAGQQDIRVGLERQWQVCEAYARHNGLRVTQIYRDVGASGLSEKRPGLIKLMDDLSRGGIRRVLAADASRLARNPQLEKRIRERITRLGVTLTTEPASPSRKEGHDTGRSSN